MTFRRHGRDRGGIGLTAGALAFLCQMIAWAWCPIAGPANVVLVPFCTPDGMVHRAVSAEDGKPVPDGGGPAGKRSDAPESGCPLGALLSGLSAPPANITLVPPGTPPRHGAPSLAGQTVATGWFLSTLQARAPPAA
ncbi:DUF2946 family protein [Arenibaculum pallidiluteum]|uniref:DUF2946 family protein n=1 Tax=Arenibaculum pallidiluteum TaxID=2812559 RepID=UPI001A9623DD|nr:DUF2946 family protein [Arenibaculum pallidiluteum]